MPNKHYEYIAYDAKQYFEYEYSVYNMQKEMWLTGLSVNIAEYSSNPDIRLRFSTPTLADQVCVQLEDLTKESHIVFME